MMLGANASVDYIADRVRAATTWTTTITTFTVPQAKLLSPPTLAMVAPLAHPYKLNVDFSIRQGTGAVTKPLLYLADGGCDVNVDAVQGKIALFKAIDRPCGCVDACVRPRLPVPGGMPFHGLLCMARG